MRQENFAIKRIRQQNLFLEGIEKTGNLEDCKKRLISSMPPSPHPMGEMMSDGEGLRLCSSRAGIPDAKEACRMVCVTVREYLSASDGKTE